MKKCNKFQDRPKRTRLLVVLDQSDVCQSSSHSFIDWHSLHSSISQVACFNLLKHKENKNCSFLSDSKPNFYTPIRSPNSIKLFYDPLFDSVLIFFLMALRKLDCCMSLANPLERLFDNFMSAVLDISIR